jgi:hypothetical protein
MPADVKPLFRADALRPKLGRFVWPEQVEAARPKLAQWSALLASGQADKKKETELLPDFIGDIFGGLLGHTGPAGGATAYTLKREALVEVDGGFADESHRLEFVREGKVAALDDPKDAAPVPDLRGNRRVSL